MEQQRLLYMEYFFKYLNVLAKYFTSNAALFELSFFVRHIYKKGSICFYNYKLLNA